MVSLLLGLFLISAIPTLMTFIYRSSSKLTAKGIYIRSYLFLLFCFVQIGYGVYVLKADENVFQSPSESEQVDVGLTKKSNKESDLQSYRKSKKLENIDGNKIGKVLVIGLGILIIFVFQFREYKLLLYFLDQIDSSDVNYNMGFWSIPILLASGVIYMIFRANVGSVFIISSIALFILLNIIQIYTVYKNTKGGKLLFIKLSVFYLGYFYLFFMGASFIYLAIILFVILFLMSFFSVSTNIYRQDEN